MISHLYRIRPSSAVLDGFRELENQQIYFSSPSELNDPVEGFNDLSWHGDKIVWRNLLKHYIVCLLRCTYLLFVSGKEFELESLRSFALGTPLDLPEAPVRSICARISDRFLSDSAVREVIEILASRTTPVKRQELTTYLRMLHWFAVSVVLEDFSARGSLPAMLSSNRAFLNSLRKDSARVTGQVSRLAIITKSQEHLAEVQFSVAEVVNEELSLIFDYNNPPNENTQPWMLFFRHFPVKYVEALDELVYPTWHTACFTANPTNSSMWGTYGAGHTGVCLKFKTPPDGHGQPSIDLHGVVGVSGTKDGIQPIRSFRPYPFHRVLYSEGYPEIDFFRSIGRVSNYNLTDFWYLGEGGARSSCADIFSNEDAWRRDYWHNFHAGSIRKTAEWAHEEEYRLVLSSSLGSLDDKAARKFNYRFSDLAGIIFGAKTNQSDKLHIMRIVDKKCLADRRSDFEFHQMEYSRREHRFSLTPLALLKPTQPVPAQNTSAKSRV